MRPHRRVQRLESLQTGAGDHHYRLPLWRDGPRGNQLLEPGNGYSTGGLCEQTLSGSEKADAVRALRFRNGYHSSARGTRVLQRVVAIRGITDSQGFGDRVRLDGSDVISAVSETSCYGVTPCRLGAIERGDCFSVDQTDARKLTEAFCRFRDQRSGRQRQNQKTIVFEIAELTSS